MNAQTSNSMNQTPLKPLKYPGLGLFMSFKYVFEIILYILKCAWRGFIYVCKDVPSFLWQSVSGKVDEAYKGTKVALEQGKNKEETQTKKSVLNMDISDLFKNSKYMKKKMEKL